MIDPSVSSPFLESPRVIYRRNPLAEVICQLKFPPILRIVAEPPAAFQERVRKNYPFLHEKVPESEMPGLPQSVAETLRKALPSNKVFGYDFISADEAWKISLTRDFLAVSTTRYRHWEEFLENLNGPLSALSEVYAPAFFSRVGLRYQNVIQRSKYEMPVTTPWAQLLKPHVTAILARGEAQGFVEEQNCQTLIKLPGAPGKVWMRYGIAQLQATNEECFVIDNDFHTQERTEIHDVQDSLRDFNRQSGKLFRWCIEDRLHESMEPQPV